MTLARFIGSCLLGIAVSHGVTAASLSINPVRLNLSAQQPVGALTLTNEGSEPVIMQLDVAAWSQTDGVDVDTPTSDLLATPPMVSIAPGASQLVRVGLRKPADAARELSYRVFLQEVPTGNASEQPQLKLRLRFGVPVFVPPTTKKSNQDLTWDASIQADTLTLRGHNDSSRHVQVTALSVRAGNDALLDVKTPLYVLPGQVRTWTLPWHTAEATRVHVDAATDAGAMQADVAPQKH